MPDTLDSHLACALSRAAGGRFAAISGDGVGLKFPRFRPRPLRWAACHAAAFDAVPPFLFYRRESAGQIDYRGRHAGTRWRPAEGRADDHFAPRLPMLAQLKYRSRCWKRGDVVIELPQCRLLIMLLIGKMA